MSMTQTVAKPARSRRGLLARIAGFEDGAIIRAAFFAMLAGTLCVLYIDYRELTIADLPLFQTPQMPVLPASNPAGPGGPPVTTDRALLEAPLTVELKNDGILELTGTIDIGAAERFAAEVAARGSYVKTIALNSPGGSVADALAIGRLIREKGFDTNVSSGSLCASSCPLILASGTRRTATAQSAIGVHQIYSATPDTQPLGLHATGMAMSDAQKTTAEITRYLADMGIDPTLWIHALETPPDRLYYFSADEMTNLELVTNLVQ
jgi:hypothetical protein